MSWMRMMLPPRRMTPPMGRQAVPTGPGIPAGVSEPSPDFFQDAGLPQLDYSHLNDNVFMPSTVFGSSRIARGLDNALLSAATFQPGQTTGENISAVAKNLIGLEPNREQMNFSRQMSPYLSMEPLLKMKAEMSDMDYRAAMAEHARAMADYYRQSGKVMGRPEIKQDAEGNYYKMNPDGTATPVTQPDTTHYDVPDMQLGNTTIPGYSGAVRGQVPLGGQLPGHRGGTAIERLIDGMEQERVANGGQPFSAQERADVYTRMAGSITGAQTSNRYGNTPGFMGQADEAGMRAELGPVDAELDRLSKMGGAALLTENAMASANGQKPVQQRIKDLTDQRNQILNKYIPHGAFGVPAAPTATSLPDIPQPVAPVAGPMRPVNVGGVPGMASPGVTDAQIAAAVQPAPQPKAAPASKPSPSTPARSGRPKVRIAPDGTIHVE